VDLFAYGFPYRNDGDHYTRICGDDMPGLFCDGRARLDEGGLFEDVNGDGTLDFVLSHHGTGALIPKYYLQLYLGDPHAPGRLDRVKDFESLFYGFNTYLRGQDMDFDGVPEILTQTAGRMLSLRGDRWGDLLPSITGAPSGAYSPVGWIDADEDGDWDFIAERKSDGAWILFSNTLNPARFMKISARGPGGVDNQYGATIRVSLPDGRTAVKSYRPMGGYLGSVDPRLVFPLVPGHAYGINACFPSLAEKSGAPSLPEGVQVEIVRSRGNCLGYHLLVGPTVRRLDLTLVAGGNGAVAKVRRP